MGLHAEKTNETFRFADEPIHSSKSSYGKKQTWRILPVSVPRGAWIREREKIYVLNGQVLMTFSCQYPL